MQELLGDDDNPELMQGKEILGNDDKELVEMLGDDNTELIQEELQGDNGLTQELLEDDGLMQELLGDDDAGDNINSLTGDSVQWQADLPLYVYSKYTFKGKKVYENELDLPYILQRMKDVLGENRRKTLVNLEFQNTTTTDLFINFIREKWQPQGGMSCKSVSHNNTIMFLSLGIALSVVFLVACISVIVARCECKRRHRGYEPADMDLRNVSASALVNIREMHRKRLRGFRQAARTKSKKIYDASELNSDFEDEDDRDLKLLYESKAQFLQRQQQDWDNIDNENIIC